MRRSLTDYSAGEYPGLQAFSGAIFLFNNLDLLSYPQKMVQNLVT